MNTEAPEAPTNAAQDRPKFWSRRWVRFLVGLLLVALVAWVLRRHFGDLGRLRDANPTAIAGLIGVYLVTRLLSADLLRLGLKELGYHVGRVEVLLLVFVRTYTNLVVPRSGLGAAGLYLKTAHRVSLAHYSSLLLPLAVFALLSVGLCGLSLQGVLWLRGDPWTWQLTALFGVATLGALTGIVAPKVIPDSWQGGPSSFVRRANAAWQLLAGRGPFVAKAVLLQCATIVLRAIRLYVAFRALGEDPDFVGLFVASLLADLLHFVALTPAALGFREFAIVYSATLTGVGEPASLAAALLDRIVVTGVTVLIAQFALWRLLGSKKTDPKKNRKPTEDETEDDASGAHD